MDGSKQEIMESTYKALCSHGYADLTIENIAEESEKGKSLIYYHFDDKEDLMLSFLDYMNNRLEEDVQELENLDPEDRLDELLELLLGVENDEMRKFQRALSELKAKAHYQEEYAEKFKELYTMLIDFTTDIMKEMKVEQPELNARIIITTVDGALDQRIILEDEEKLGEIKEKMKELSNCKKLN